MKKFLACLIILIFPLHSIAEEVAIVNLDFLLNSSTKGQKLAKKYQNLNKKNLDFFKDKEKKLSEKESQIISKKKILSEEDFKKEANKFQEEIKKYNSIKTEKINEVKKQREKDYSEFLKEINSILVDFSKKNEISTIIDKKYIIISKSKNDITKDILNILNK